MLSGDAEATADYSGIRVTMIGERAEGGKSEGEEGVAHESHEFSRMGNGEVILKFHYADWLTADNGVTLESVEVLDDPVPFIRAIVPGGVESFVIGKE